MSKSPIGQALSALNKIAGSEMLHKLGLYEPATKLAYRASREGFRSASAHRRGSGRRRKQLVKPGAAAAGPSARSDLFDLTVSEEQQMIRDMAQRFAREVHARSGGGLGRRVQGARRTSRRSSRSSGSRSSRCPRRSAARRPRARS